jgi:hypothetical protein
VHHQLAVQPRGVRQRQYAEVRPDERAVLRLLAEGDPPHVRVQPVRADDEIETTTYGVLELHLAVG